MNIPGVVKVKQHFSGPTLHDIDKTVTEQFTRSDIRESIRPGMNIAITAGSRGIANIASILRAVVRECQSLGAEVCIIPAMGSHGGATAHGQVEVLHSLNVTEEFCGAPIRSSMDVEQIGETADGVPVYCDRIALSMDGIILLNRIKRHTDFSSPWGLESGLMKMAAIGLGKHAQALQLHSFGVHGICDIMPGVAKVVLQKAHVLCGVGIVENAFEQTAHIEVIPTAQITEREPELLKLSTSLMPRLPVEKLDLLIVDTIGKNYSGTGMDTNIIGRMRIVGIEEPASPDITYILASDLSAKSHGNALGMGLADLTTRRLFEKIDFQVTNENVITSTFLHRAMLPIVLENDREAIKTAMRACWGISPERLRLMRIPDTLHLEYLYVSEPLLPEIQELSNVEVLGPVEPPQFDQNGYLLPFHDKI